MDHDATSRRVGPWSEWANHVLIELEELNKGMKERDRKMSSMQNQITVLQVKCGIWAVVGASIPLLIAYFIRKGG